MSALIRCRQEGVENNPNCWSEITPCPILQKNAENSGKSNLNISQPAHTNPQKNTPSGSRSVQPPSTMSQGPFFRLLRQKVPRRLPADRRGKKSAPWVAGHVIKMQEVKIVGQ